MEEWTQCKDNRCPNRRPNTHLHSYYVALSLTPRKQEVLVRTNRLLSFETTLTSSKTTPPTFLHFRGNVFTESLPSNYKGIYRQAHGLSFDNTRTIQKTTPATILPLLCVFVVARTCLPIRCLATIGRIYRHTDWWERFIKVSLWDWLRCHDIQYTPSFIKIGSGIKKLMEGGIHRHTDSKSTFKFSK
jgi:hypothetical protein